MGGDDDGSAGIPGVAENQIGDQRAGSGIQIPGRFVGENQAGSFYQRPGHCGPLAFSTGNIGRKIMCTIPEPLGDINKNVSNYRHVEPIWSARLLPYGLLEPFFREQPESSVPQPSASEPSESSVPQPSAPELPEPSEPSESSVLEPSASGSSVFSAQ